MYNFDKQINDLISEMDKENIPKDKQIEHLKKLSSTLYNKKEKLEGNFIVGTFISGCGLGIMTNNNLTSTYISVGMIGLGIIISFSSIKLENKIPKIKNKKIH